MNHDSDTRAFREGKSAGLAIAAIAGGAVAFISLLGLEKAILAILLAVLARRGAAPESHTRRLASVAIGLGLLYVVIFAVVMALFRDELGELIRLLQQMG
jgi:Mn2+/Fe2+ NRAMP family transporter